MLSRMLIAVAVGLLLVPGARAGVVYVNAAASGANNGQSWADAFTELTSALAAAKAGDEIWVARGTYRPAGPGGDRISNFALKSKVMLYGGFVGGETDRSQRDWKTNETILSGDLNGDDQPGFVNYADNVFNVVTCMNVYAPLGMDGFTVRGGNADNFSNEPPYRRDRGGGLYGEFTSPSIINCLFVENFTYHEGGGAYLRTFGGLVSNCEFRGNSAHTGGGLYLNVEAGSGGCVRDSLFVGNTATVGGGLYTASATPGVPTAVRCIFRENVADQGGGAAHSGGHYVACVFIGNTAYGSALSGQGSTRLFDCVCASNSGKVTVWIVGNDTVRIENCSIVGNAANTAAVWSNAVHQQIVNNVIWGNTVDPWNDSVYGQLNLSNYPDKVVSWNCIQNWEEGTYPGQGNTGADPMLVDPVGPDGIPWSGDEDIHLGVGSPAIDAASSANVSPDLADLDADGDLSEPVPLDASGTARLVDDPAILDTGEGPGPVVDMGALEFQAAACYADFTGDGVLDLFDFLGFVNSFNALAPAADCDKTGTFDLFDFLCFTNAFNAGC